MAIKSKAKVVDSGVGVKVLIKHPMETGLRKDKKTGEPIPAHFISEVTRGEIVPEPDFHSDPNQTLDTVTQ